MAYALQETPLLPKQDELRNVRCGVESLEEVITHLKERQKKEAPLFDEIENINRL